MYGSMFVILCFSLFFLLFSTCDGFFSLGKKYCRSRNVRLSRKSTLFSPISQKICLPIIQVYEHNVLLGEFFMGNDYDRALLKFNAFMSSFSENSRNRTHMSEHAYSLSNLSSSIENVYSERMLSLYTSLNPIVVLKLYRFRCKICQQIEPVFRDIATEDRHSHIIFLQGNLDDLPRFEIVLQRRLSGKDEQSNDNTISFCDTCSSSGFVLCISCNGSGIIQRGENFLLCPMCAGYKKLKCAECGSGGCLKC